MTGKVAVTLGATNEGMVAGDAVNTAARVQAAAEPGQVLSDRATQRPAESAIGFADAGEHALKGKTEPQHLWRAFRVLAGVGGSQRVDGLEAPPIGRDAELRTIRELFHAAAGRRVPRLVLVSGPAGVGKSRLGWEFEKYLDGLVEDVWWHRGRCLSYGKEVAFWALAEIAFLLLGQHPHELLTGPDSVPRRQRPQHHRHVRHRLEWDIAARAGDQHPSRHHRRHQGPDDQRAGSVTIEADGENDQHHHGGSGMVGMEDGQAYQQQRHHGDQDAERVAAPHHQRQGGHQGETGIEGRQLLHLMAGEGIDERRGEGDEGQHHVKIRSAQQPSQRGADT